MRAERRKVVDAGVTFVRKVGADIGEADWAFFERCYARTYAAHHSTPYLTRAFFLELARTMPETLLLVVARRDGRPIASARESAERSCTTSLHVLHTPPPRSRASAAKGHTYENLNASS